MTRLNGVLIGLVLVAFVVAIVVDVQRRGKVAAQQALDGRVERCITCHRDGANAKTAKAHPKVPGHGKLKIGCTACHGGDGQRADKGAHEPPVGMGARPFYPLAFTSVACARCHVPGVSRVIAKGQRQYTESGCVSCHQPGRRSAGLGYDLRYRPAKTIAEIRRHLLDPGEAVNRGKMMWSVRDATYRGRFDPDTKEGKQNLDALIAYLLVLGDAQGRIGNKKGWFHPKLRVDGECTKCHALGADKASGALHSCVYLRDNPTLDCKRCHGSAMPKPSATKPASARCPQVQAAYPLCTTCHLRDDDGAAELLSVKP